MSRVVRELSLPRQGSPELAVCVLRAEVSQVELLKVDTQWHAERTEVIRQLMELGVSRDQWPQSWHWDWTRKLLGASALTHALYTVMEGERYLAAMLLRLDPRIRARLAPDAGKELAYVDFIESAPSNWTVPALGQVQRVKGLGTALILAAIERSIAEEMGGRVGLHSLPQSEPFYGALGMTNLGPDLVKQGLTYYEFTGAAAHGALTEGGWL